MFFELTLHNPTEYQRRFKSFLDAVREMHRLRDEYGIPFAYASIDKYVVNEATGAYVWVKTYKLCR